MIITVGKDGKCDFNTIQEALDSIQAERPEAEQQQQQQQQQEQDGNQIEKIVIKIKPGIYEEKLVIGRPNITMIGGAEEDGGDEGDTVITYGDFAKMTMPDGSPYGTFRTATFRVDADDFTAENITFVNSAGDGKEHGQAVAVYADGDRIAFFNCRMIACQDTLFTAPLPPKKPGTGNNGKGPKADEERRNGRHYFYKCYIRGDIDFIFGGATAFFEDCEIFSQNGIIEDEAKLPQKGPDDKIFGYVTAACTMEGQEYGYVFYNCRFTSDCPKDSIFLGRPWRDYAKTVLIKCSLGEHIKTEGWHDWGRAEAQPTTYYAEYQSICARNNSNLSERASWSHQLTDEEAAKYERTQVLGDWIIKK